MAKSPHNIAPHDPTGVSIHPAPAPAVVTPTTELTAPAVVTPNGKPPGMTDKRFANAKSFNVACTWRRSGGDLPAPSKVEYVYDESEAINRYASSKGLYTPDCRFAVTAG